MALEGTVVTLEGELDAGTRVGVERRLLDAVAAGRPVLVDVGGLTFCDSVGLFVLLRAHAEAEEAGLSFALRNTPPHLTRLLEVTGLSDALRA